MTDYLDIFEFSSKAAYALYLKNGNEDGTTRGGYLNSSLAQGRIMSNVSSDFWRHHSESGSRIQGHFDDSLRCGSLNFHIERDDSLFQDYFWWEWLRHSKMLLRIPWGSHLLSKQSAPAFCSSWIWHRFHHDEGCVTEDGPLRGWWYHHQLYPEQLRAIRGEIVCELFRFLELSFSSPPVYIYRILREVSRRLACDGLVMHGNLKIDSKLIYFEACLNKDITLIRCF